MRVKATQKGFYKKLRRANDEFVIESRLSGGSKAENEADIEAQFSDNWMEKLPVRRVAAKRKAS